MIYLLFGFITCFLYAVFIENQFMMGAALSPIFIVLGILIYDR